MASINSVLPDTSGSAATSNSSSSQTPTSAAQASQNQFLQLLVAQLQGQDPLNPMDGTQFVSQLAQFSSLTELTGMHSDLDSINTYFQTAAAQNAAAAQAAAAAQSAPTSSTDSSNASQSIVS